MNSTKNKIYVTSEYVDIGTIFDDEMHDITAYRDRIVSELNRIQERAQAESLYVDLEVTDIPHCDTVRVSLYREETDDEFNARINKQNKEKEEQAKRKKEMDEAFGSVDYMNYIKYKKEFHAFLEAINKNGKS